VIELNELTYKIRGAIFEVHKILGPGLLESVYEAALAYELELLGLEIKRQKAINSTYKEVDLGLGFRADIVVANSVIIEIKSVENLHPVFWKTLLTYLKQSKIRLGILVNFNVEKLVDKESIIRVIN
jgi:GxxExxY protein